MISIETVASYAAKARTVQLYETESTETGERRRAAWHPHGIQTLALDTHSHTVSVWRLQDQIEHTLYVVARCTIT